MKPIENEGNILTVTDSNVTINGRYYVDKSSKVCYFSNTYAGIDFCFKGTSLEVDFIATEYKVNLNAYAKVFVDNLEPIDMKIATLGYMPIVKDLKDEIHTVKIVKRNESNSNAMGIRKLKISEDGTFYTAKKPETERKIEVLGDSITCGFGNLYTSGNSVDVSSFEDGTKTFAVMAADHFKAQLQEVAISGIGIACTATGDPYKVIDTYIKKDARSTEDYDFKSYIPDVVVIALGTNDSAGKASTDEFIKQANILIDTIRKNRPNAQIIWTYGVMNNNLVPTITEIVKSYNDKGDKKIYFVVDESPKEDELPMGLYAHPSYATHKRMANTLINKIAEVTGWSK